MTTGEDTAEAMVTPIGFASPEKTSIAFTGSDDIDIGHVALILGADPGCSLVPAAPTFDLDCNGIQDVPIFIEVESDDLEIITRVSDPLDDDRDYLVDAYEDDDDDGIPNCKDDNSRTDDFDGDGIENEYDVDDDNDGLMDDEDDDDYSDEYDEDYEEEDHDESGSAPIFTNDDPSMGRLLLATQCAQCHGTDGYSLTEIDSIAQEERNEILAETIEDAADPEDLMGFHGSVYQRLTPELEAIADYLSKQ